MAIVEESSVAAAELRLTTNPVPNSGRKVTIGADTYWFGDSPGPGEFAVPVALNVSGTRANLVTAINAGNENVLAATYENVVRIVAAGSPGGSPVAGPGPNLPLNYNAGGLLPVDRWDVSNLMQTEDTKFSSGVREADTILKQQDTLRVTFAFTPTEAAVECTYKRMVRNVTATIQGQDLVIPLAGCREGSKIRWYVYGN